MHSPTDIVLAFSGGLDTSFCVPWLNEHGYRVTTLFVNTGGMTAAQRDAIEQRALDLGAHRHITQDASDDLFHDFVIPFIQAGACYQEQYPLLCSDRYIIAQRMTQVAQEIGTNVVAHGCTAAGNDQFRFDQSIRSLGSFDIVAPIRAIQAQTTSLRSYETEYLQARGFAVQGKAGRYTINENCLGVTISGAEIDAFDAPGDETFCITAPPAQWPRDATSATISFERGVPQRLDHEKITGPELLRTLHERFGACGVGRGIYTGDTTIGLKGRIVFESPALAVLLTAHRALEECVLTKLQNAFKPIVARRWVEVVYEGFFFDPLRTDLEQFISATQEHVTGDVTVQSGGGVCHAVATHTPFALQRDDATYAQGAPWTAEQAEGFIALYGQSSTMAQMRSHRLAGVQQPCAV